MRPARSDEYEEAGRVTALAYREFAGPEEDWRRYLDRIADVADRVQRTLVLVAVDDGRVLGTVTLELDERTEPAEDDESQTPLPSHEAHVRMLGVSPEARGRGIGRRLMEAAIAEARARGKTIVTLNTTRPMRAAQRMYESMGFQRDEDRVFDDGFVLMSYRLPLPADGGAETAESRRNE